MSQICPKCGHERGSDEIVPDYECPRCGVVYQKYLERLEKQQVPIDPPVVPLPGMPFTGMPAGETAASEPETPRRRPVVSEPQSSWRLFGLILAAVALIVVAAISSRGRGLRGPTAANFPYDLRGTWSGSTIERVSLRDRPPYEAEYSARFTVDDKYRLIEIEWTAAHQLLRQETAYWQWPRTVSYTSQRRNGVSDSFLRPPQGTYTQLLLSDGELTMESHQDGDDALRQIDATFPIASPSGSVFWSDGSFRRLHKEEAVEAVARGGFAKFGPIELDPSSVTLELPPAAAAEAFRPYLRGAKPWPEGMAENPAAPSEGLDLDGVSVLDLPGFAFSIRSVRALFASREYGRNDRTESLDWVELTPESRIIVHSDQSKSWAAHVVFFRDGHAVVRLPNRDLEIPVERVDGPPAAEEVSAETAERTAR